MLTLQYDPSFVEEAVFLVLKARREVGDGELARAFDVERLMIYDHPSVSEERGQRFQELARRYLHVLGLHELFEQRLKEVPQLEQLAGWTLVHRVWSRREERVELLVPPEASDPLDAPPGRRGLLGGSSRLVPSAALGARQARRSRALRLCSGLGTERSRTCRVEGLHLQTATLCIDLQAIRCVDSAGLIMWLRHECRHVEDMLDPAFAYDPHRPLGGVSRAEDDLIRERFRLLWDVSVEARLQRKGWMNGGDRSDRRRAFDRMVVGWPAHRRETVWEALRRRSQWTHQELLTLAREDLVTPTAGPGSARCPLCGFPTQERVSDWSQRPAGVVESIRVDFPTWQPADGACRQCVELYGARLTVTP